jgi:predicted CoA-binding protein
MMFENPSQTEIFDILQSAKNIAIVGLSDKPKRTSYQVAQVVQEQGYHIFPVNPMLRGQTILGETVYGSLADIPVKIDIVDVFRRSEFLPAVAEETLKTDAPVFWAQLGLKNETAAQMLQAAGRKVIMDRCIKIELAALAETDD